MANSPTFTVHLPHNWVLGKNLGFNSASNLHNMEICKACGVVRRKFKDGESSCKGKVKVVLREKK